MLIMRCNDKPKHSTPFAYVFGKVSQVTLSATETLITSFPVKAITNQGIKEFRSYPPVSRLTNHVMGLLRAKLS